MAKIPLPSVLGARPIRLIEFMDAVAETCPPIFGSFFRTPGVRDVGIAVSGGVDSMALAVLCSLAKNSMHLRIGDHRPREFRPFVVDHSLREGSAAEVQNVIDELSKLDVQTQWSPIKLHWDSLLRQFGVDHPSKLPGLEALARRLRYRALARACVNSHITSLLVAHHEDDQYETILMRLLGGHGPRGLRGVQRAVDIPESADIHRAYQSGFHDDRSSAKQLYIMVPTPRQRGALRDAFRELDPEEYQADMRRASSSEWDRLQDLLSGANIGSWARSAPPLETLDIEAGGITVYRPLLGFPKDRLEATCLHHGIQWFEDHTNLDPTFAVRNALRHVWKNNALPKALRKPSILALAQRCSAIVEAEEAEVDRLLQRTIISNFQPNVGTAMVRFPKYGIDTFSSRDRRTARRRHLRILRRRAIAALAIRKCFSLVSPTHQTELSMLRSFVAVFFPGLEIGVPSGSQQTFPSAIALAGVYCVPMPCHPSVKEKAHHLSNTTWLLSRAPFPSNKKPTVHIGTTRYSMWSRHVGAYLPFHNFDGRFWISVLHRLPTSIAVAPFSPEHSKSFREALDVSDRKKLEALLKQYAPGKTRFTLPALYLTRLRDGNFFRKELEAWGNLLEKVNAANIDSVYNCGMKADGSGPADEDSTVEELKRIPRSKEKFKYEPTQDRTLIALPTLGIQVKGLEKLMKCQVRYKNVDLGMLNDSGTWGSSEFWARWSDEIIGRRAWHYMIRRKLFMWRKMKRSDLREDRKMRALENEEEEVHGSDRSLEGWH